MSWTFRLFACNVDKLANNVRTSKSLTDEVIRHVETATDADAADLRMLRHILCSGLAGDWPDDGTTDSFSALCWLLEVTAENVTPPELSNFRGFGMMQETGLLQYFSKCEEILPMPASRSGVGRSGFLKNEKMSAVLKDQSAAKPITDAYVRRFHTYLLDTIEAIAEEGKDLLLVTFC